jgi:hypothetical protein
MTGVQGETITTGSTAATVIALTDVDYNEPKDFFIKVVSGSIKFGVDSIATNATAFASTDTIPPIRCFNGHLYFKGGATDTFYVTASA